MPFKRRKEGKTDYQQRLRLLKSGAPRLVIRRSLNYITAQIAEFGNKGDKVVVAASSRELKKLGWNFACDNISAAYLTGLLIGKSAVEKKLDGVIPDSGLYAPVRGSRIFAVIKGAKDAGMSMSVEDEMLPSDERIKGMHISSNEKFKNLTSEFEKVKNKILGG